MKLPTSLHQTIKKYSRWIHMVNSSYAFFGNVLCVLRFSRFSYGVICVWNVINYWRKWQTKNITRNESETNYGCYKLEYLHFSSDMCTTIANFSHHFIYINSMALHLTDICADMQQNNRICSDSQIVNVHIHSDFVLILFSLCAMCLNVSIDSNFLNENVFFFVDGKITLCDDKHFHQFIGSNWRYWEFQNVQT